MKAIYIIQGQVHSFSRVIAEQYGVNAALVLAHLGYKIQRSKHVHDGKQWYYETLDSLTQRYPYLSRTAIHDAIQRLTVKNGPLLVGNYNRKGYDRTKWYAFRDENTARLLNKRPVYFKAESAAFYGIPAAVVLNNLAYWIIKNRETKPNYRLHPLSSSTLSEILPFSRSTIQRP